MFLDITSLCFFTLIGLQYNNVSPSRVRSERPVPPNLPRQTPPADIRSPKVRFSHWRFLIAVPRNLDESERYERVRRAFVNWYKARAAVRLDSNVRRWWPQLGRGDQPRILIRDQRQRWGSCAPDGTLRFNWRAMMLPPALIEYVIVHELAHLTVKNHSSDFWGLVSKAMPDAQHRRRSLREAGRSLPL